jgi:hypothetical protein
MIKVFILIAIIIISYLGYSAYQDSTKTTKEESIKEQEASVVQNKKSEKIEKTIVITSANAKKYMVNNFENTDSEQVNIVANSEDKDIVKELTKSLKNIKILFLTKDKIEEIKPNTVNYVLIKESSEDSGFITTINPDIIISSSILSYAKESKEIGYTDSVLVSGNKTKINDNKAIVEIIKANKELFVLPSNNSKGYQEFMRTLALAQMDGYENLEERFNIDYKNNTFEEVSKESDLSVRFDLSNNQGSEYSQIRDDLSYCIIPTINDKYFVLSSNCLNGRNNDSQYYNKTSINLPSSEFGYFYTKVFVARINDSKETKDVFELLSNDNALRNSSIFGYYK